MTINTNSTLTLIVPARSEIRNVLLLAFMLLVFVASASAQVSISTGGSGTGTIGQDGWNAMKSMWFGPLGLILGASVFGLSLYYFFKEGVLAVIGVLGIGILFFFVPAITQTIQNFAKSF